MKAATQRSTNQRKTAAIPSAIVALLKDAYEDARHAGYVLDSIRLVLANLNEDSVDGLQRLVEYAAERGNALAVRAESKFDRAFAEIEVRHG